MVIDQCSPTGYLTNRNATLYVTYTTIEMFMTSQLCTHKQGPSQNVVFPLLHYILTDHLIEIDSTSTAVKALT